MNHLSITVVYVHTSSSLLLQYIYHNISQLPLFPNLLSFIYDLENVLYCKTKGLLMLCSAYVGQADAGQAEVKGKIFHFPYV